MMLADHHSFTPRFVGRSSHQLHLSAGEGKAMQIENCFFPDLHVGKTLSAKSLQHRWRNLVRTHRPLHGTREITNEAARLGRRAYRSSGDQSYSAADLISEKSIHARRREIGFWSFEQHIRI